MAPAELWATTATPLPDFFPF